MAADYRQATRKDDFGGRMGAGPLATLANNPYQFSSLNYPIDIENLSHAMLFNINVHDNSNDLSKRETPAENATGPTAGFQSRRDRNLQNTPSLTRKFTRIKRAISLYMPDTIVVDNRQNFETPSLLEKLGIIGTSLVAGAQSLTESFGQAGNIAMGLTGGAAAAAAAVGAAMRGASVTPNRSLAVSGAAMGLSKFDRGVLTPALRTATSLFGYALNPVVEVLYVSPLLRAFNFDFIFSPKSAKEADDVWKIIYEFKRHSAPEFLNNSQSGVGSLVNYIMIPPSQFEITFLRKSQSSSVVNSNPNSSPDGNSNDRVGGARSTGFVENTNLPRLSTCVLQDVMVDYTPTGGFVTFDDGMPVQIRMRLSFIETNIITREMVDEGY
jgi:hypothetical protein